MFGGFGMNGFQQQNFGKGGAQPAQSSHHLGRKAIGQALCDHRSIAYKESDDGEKVAITEQNSEVLIVAVDPIYAGLQEQMKTEKAVVIPVRGNLDMTFSLWFSEALGKRLDFSLMSHGQANRLLKCIDTFNRQEGLVPEGCSRWLRRMKAERRQRHRERVARRLREFDETEEADTEHSDLDEMPRSQAQQAPRGPQGRPPSGYAHTAFRHASQAGNGDVGAGNARAGNSDGHSHGAGGTSNGVGGPSNGAGGHSSGGAAHSNGGTGHSNDGAGHSNVASAASGRDSARREREEQQFTALMGMQVWVGDASGLTTAVRKSETGEIFIEVSWEDGSKTEYTPSGIKDPLLIANDFDEVTAKLQALTTSFQSMATPMAFRRRRTSNDDGDEMVIP